MSLWLTSARQNEHVTIPNSIALNNSMTNYRRTANTSASSCTSVTAWPRRPVADRARAAHRGRAATPGLLQEPSPFVWQTALNDFYVTYEINAYTATPHDMVDIYAALHARIQDTFYAAGVEIMSPHFAAVRDGNTVAIPEANRPAGYRAPRFRVDGLERSSRDERDRHHGRPVAAGARRAQWLRSYRGGGCSPISSPA
jgi:hypothetical protein